MKTASLLAAISVLFFSSSLTGHHSGSMYSSTPLWVGGTVISFEQKSPHSIITLETESDDGVPRRWAIEGPPGPRLDSVSLPAVGDVVEFCAFPYKPAEELARMFPEADFSSGKGVSGTPEAGGQYLAGHVLRAAGGELQLWYAQGLMSECMRSSDAPEQDWLDFLNGNATALQWWCQQLAYAVVTSDPSLFAFTRQFNSLLNTPCKQG